LEAEVRLYDRLFNAENPLDTDEEGDYKDNINPDSLAVVPDAQLEPSLKEAEPGAIFQFERIGYFCADAFDSKPGKPIFNRTVTLKDTWAKLAKKK
jgi:glutaminyl-tRNA synthetase